ncbi:MAG: hypothetical protein COV79_03830 [Parcubacteria group bacterium CG11_big_fil_rev_8_21_14_0_20_41_14]|nr:MAG: hypothetical protein COV79_03830 [Parcubacteria group bacterium CG11_big_fil_rev_8_21_14_0_20_41_14]
MKTRDDMKILNKIIEYGILLFVFLIPWQARLILQEGSINGDLPAESAGYWEYGTKSLYATEVLLLIILIAVIIRGAIYIAKAKPRFNLKRVFSPAGALLLLIIWAGATIIWSIDPNIALERWIVLVEAIAVFLILSSGAVSFKKLSWAIILSGLIQALFGLYQFLLQEVPSSTWIGIASQKAEDLGVSVVETDLRRWLRAYGTFSHPNMLGGWLVLSLMLVIDKMKAQSQSLIDVLRYPIYIVLLFGLLATFSRSAWLGFGVFLIGFVIMLFVRKKWMQGIKIILISILSVACFYSLFSEPMNTRLGLQGRLEIKSNMERVSSMNQGWEIIKKHPMLGVGIGNFGLAVHDEINDSQQAWFYQPVHNVLLLIWAELGIVGVIFVLLFLLVSLLGVSSTLRTTRQSYHRNDTVIFLIPLIIIFLLDHYPWSLYAGMMISAVFLGMSILYAREASSRQWLS